ncbi:MAG: DUF4179 domain-containing protein [Eubacteriales bacterium]|nr:DUF4179 domain-containing protein [Eubacteriales bacterium]
MKKTKPVAALVLAAVLALALAGVAYAAVQSGVLRYLFGETVPTARQQEMVQTVGASHESDGITTTLSDLVFDGRELSFGLQFALTRNAFVVVDQVTINGVRAYEINSNLSDMWLCAPLEPLESACSRGVTVSIDKAYFDEADYAALEQAYQQIQQTGTADVSVALSLLTPKGELAPVNIYTNDTAAMWEQIDAAIAAGQTPISQDEPFEVMPGSAALGDEFHKGLPAQHPMGNADAYAAYANMTILDAFSMDFSISAADAADAELQAMVQRSPTNDGRVHITFDEVRFTPFATDIRLSITPEEGYMTNEDIARIYRWFAFYDEKHEPIQLLSSAVETSSTGFEEQADGTLIYRVEVHLGALASTPEAINLVPYNEESSAEHPLWDYCIFLPYTYTSTEP